MARRSTSNNSSHLKSSSRLKTMPRPPMAPRRRTETGQELSVTTIIIAAIALIVLVVLVAVFTGQMGIFSRGLDKEKKGYTCMDTPPAGLDGIWKTDPCPTGQEFFGVTDSADLRLHSGMHCCRK